MLHGESPCTPLCSLTSNCFHLFLSYFCHFRFLFIVVVTFEVFLVTWVTERRFSLLCFETLHFRFPFRWNVTRSDKMQNLGHFSSLSPANCETHKACNQNNHRKKKTRSEIKKIIREQNCIFCTFSRLKITWRVLNNRCYARDIEIHIIDFDKNPFKTQTE